MAPCRTDELNQLLSPPETSSRMRCVLPEASDDALFERVNRSSAAAASTRSLVAGATLVSPRRARETVASETPASLATSWMVERAIGVPPCCVVIVPSMISVGR